MIITRAPLRITFGGGGTDLPSYYRQFGGELVAAGIDKYIYIALHRIFPKEFIIKYSQIERVSEVAAIQHPIIREVLTAHKVDPRLEIVSFADIPDGTGLGSSGSFTVALLKAITFYKRQHILPGALAEEACDIEIEKMGRPTGKQDQYIASFGGITRFIFHKNDEVEVKPLDISSKSLHDLEDHLLLFFTGYSRSAASVLDDQNKKTVSMDKEMLMNLHFTKELGQESGRALESGNISRFGELMHVHWENKKKRTNGMSNPKIDDAYAAAMEAGALGGKLIGAGAGGFLMFYAKNPAAVREAMQAQGLEPVRFKFDFEGAKVVST